MFFGKGDNNSWRTTHRMRTVDFWTETMHECSIVCLYSLLTYCPLSSINHSIEVKRSLSQQNLHRLRLWATSSMTPTTEIDRFFFQNFLNCWLPFVLSSIVIVIGCDWCPKADDWGDQMLNGSFNLYPSALVCWFSSFVCLSLCNVNTMLQIYIYITNQP